ncbi:nicotinate-nucleotide--dimethylbenzimidazole phosphoribosyltransferase [Algihabitans albus]|uniref:nicotinate-nucleotide--dimethylbenzimidazole phosphoribosyltransferase n=1 Tax=Algihabitans albus TaxID=2164067 RepID=UPI000E5CD1DD|nr:nicotinate-nucleotide--dimethylbenzimidazole phosphoribosyltransferase [Algihabitans albus]
MSDQPNPSAVSLTEIRDILKRLPGPDLTAGSAAEARQRDLLKPPGSLGRLEELAVWLATWQGRASPRIERPHVAVFAGSHGVAGRAVSAYPPEVTQQMVGAFVNGLAAVNQLASEADADLRVYEMALELPTADITQGPAMGEEDAAHAMAYGMMAIEEGLDVVALGEMGIGNTTAAAALACGLFGGTPADWVGPGTGVDAAGIQRKTQAVAAALDANARALPDPLTALAALGGRELAAIAGAVLACRAARIPVVLDGYACSVAAAVLYKADPRALDHCLVAHRSAEPGHARLLEAIGKRPLLDFDLRLGEGSGAALTLPLLKAACAVHNGMATFAEAGVSGKAE